MEKEISLQKWQPAFIPENRVFSWLTAHADLVETRLAFPGRFLAFECRKGDPSLWLWHVSSVRIARAEK